MPTAHQCRRHRDEGYTLIELLVVVLILGILAAIAIPSFINQKSKANDAEAKSQARTLQIAAETLGSDGDSSYVELNLKRLETIEPTLTDHEAAVPSTPVEGKAKEYEVASESRTTQHRFKIKRSDTGIVTRTCEPAGVGACPKSGEW